MKILVTSTAIKPGDAALEKLEAFADEVVYSTTGKPLTAEELLPLLKDCDGYIAGLDCVTGDVLRACPRLKAISRYGVGYDQVDIRAARECGISVTNTPGANAQAVGELAFVMMMALARKLVYLDKCTKENQWVSATGMEMRGKTLGIVGLGAIGKAVAACASGFGMRVLAYGPHIDQKYCKEHRIESLPYEELVRQADFVSLHIPLLPDTRHIVNREVLGIMKDGAILINASRGGLIDEEAACEALKSGKLGGLGLDVFEEEPPEDSPLFAFDNVIVTPHTGANTEEAIQDTTRMAVDNLIDLLSSGESPYIVNRSSVTVRGAGKLDENRRQARL